MPMDERGHLPRPGVPLLGTLAGTTWDLVAHHEVGSPGGGRRAAELGVGAGLRFLAMAANAVVLGGIRLCHRWPDAVNHGPGPAPV
jgi:hypothetical protein